MKGTEFALRSIAALGVEHLFMFVGGLVDPFLPEACAGVVTPIVCANEAGVGYAADGYARASGKFGAMLVIGGAGTFNTVGAMGAPPWTTSGPPCAASSARSPPPPWTRP